MSKKKKKKVKKIKSVSFKNEKVNYDKVKHTTSVDQSDRQVPYNLRQSGPTKVEMLISTRVRKSPFWHLSMKAGCWRATIVKGVMSSEDALKIKNSGVDSVYVSNHGGRQLDSALSSIDALPIIRKAVGKDYPLIFDSGIRGGSDILRALALGANFVMIGRPLMYGIGADGASGLRKVIDIIKEELSTTLGLVGLREIEDVSSEIIAKKHFQNLKY